MKPINRTLTFLGSLLILPIMMLGGLAIGVLLYWISKTVYLIILFPLLASVLGLKILASYITRLGIHIRILGIAAGLLMGLALYGSYHAASYFNARAEAVASINADLEKEHGRPDSTLASRMLDSYFLEETGYTGFPGFMILKSRSGISFRGFAIYGIPYALNIGPTLTWLYWLMEAAIFLFLLVFGGSIAAGQPFCAYHNAWYGPRKHLGGVPRGKLDEIMRMIRHDNFFPLGSILEEDAAVPSVEVFVQDCENCMESNPRITVEEVTSLAPSAQNQRRLRRSINPAQYAELRNGIRARSTPAG